LYQKAGSSQFEVARSNVRKILDTTALNEDQYDARYIIIGICFDVVETLK